jgi:hypothetical protein
MDGGDGRDDGQPEPEAVIGDVRSLSRSNGWKMRSTSVGLMKGPVLATVS